MQRLFCAIVSCVFAVSVFATGTPFLGSWDLNPTKSKFDPSGPKIQSQTIKYYIENGVFKSSVTIDGSPSAHPTVYDGKEHEYGGTSALRPTHIIPTAKENTLETVFKRDGKKIGTRKNTLSPDGRTMTVTSEGTKADGSPYKSVLVFDKQ
ncbi:MAG TPA: hypothetical protein VEX68_08140 [Bryobacteraceae bacterium]|nr:hypothetical protein [Bryobacteraceae bacterium]